MTKKIDPVLSPYVGKMIYALKRIEKPGYSSLTLWRLNHHGKLIMEGYVQGFECIDLKENKKKLDRFTKGFYLDKTPQMSQNDFLNYYGRDLDSLFSDQETKTERLLYSEVNTVREYKDHFSFGEEEKLLKKYKGDFSASDKSGELIVCQPVFSEDSFLKYIRPCIKTTDTGYVVTYYVERTEAYDIFTRQYNNAYLSENLYLPNEDFIRIKRVIQDRERKKRGSVVALNEDTSDDEIQRLAEKAIGALNYPQDKSFTFDEKDAIYSVLDYVLYHMASRNLPASQCDCVGRFLDRLYNKYQNLKSYERYLYSFEDEVGASEKLTMFAPASAGWFIFESKDLTETSIKETKEEKIWLIGSRDKVASVRALVRYAEHLLEIGNVYRYNDTDGVVEDSFVLRSVIDIPGMEEKLMGEISSDSIVVSLQNPKSLLPKTHK